MTKENYTNIKTCIEQIQDIVKGNPFTFHVKIKKIKELNDFLLEQTSFLLEHASYGERVYCLLHGI